MNWKTWRFNRMRENFYIPAGDIFKLRKVDLHAYCNVLSSPDIESAKFGTSLLSFLGIELGEWLELTFLNLGKPIPKIIIDKIKNIQKPTNN